ncbi:MAG: LPS export ABC transporter periplasmic protein LptC [Bacteroidaceae bacterium]|nr:LPS export ABC transporter periplasmic protein LptC [Bacteroidaceae bacterium]
MLFPKRGWLVTALVLFVLISCSNSKKEVENAVTDRDSMPLMATTGVDSYISDSGVVRYHIIAEMWDIFDKKDPSYWAFEKGLKLEQIDLDRNVVATLTADTAYYYDREEKWELRGNVHSVNVNDEEFETELLFWNQKRERIYSDKRIRVKQKNQYIVGTGFESNQDFTRYTIKQTEGMFPIQE